MTDLRPRGPALRVGDDEHVVRPDLEVVDLPGQCGEGPGHQNPTRAGPDQHTETLIYT